MHYRDGGEIILVPNGSPFEAGKTDMRVHHAVARVVESKRPLVYLNQIGGQDELVFDGASFIMNADGLFVGSFCGKKIWPSPTGKER